MGITEIFGWIIAIAVFAATVWPMFSKDTLPEVLARHRLWPVTTVRDEASSDVAMPPRWGSGIQIISLLVALSLFAVLTWRQLSDIDEITTLRSTVEAQKLEIEGLKESIPSQNQQPKNPTAMLFVRDPLIVTNPAFETDEVSSINFYLENAGPEIARDTIWTVTHKVVPLPSSATEEREVLDEVSGALAAAIDVSNNYRDVIPGSKGRLFQTLNLLPTENVAQQIRNETMRMYLMVRAEWTDSAGAHVMEKCVYMPRPEVGSRQAWRLCGSHNFTR